MDVQDCSFYPGIVCVPDVVYVALMDLQDTGTATDLSYHQYPCTGIDQYIVFSLFSDLGQDSIRSLVIVITAFKGIMPTLAETAFPVNAAFVSLF